MSHPFTKFSFFLFLFAFFGGIISFLPLNANALTCNSDCYENYNDPQNDCTCISSWGEICGADGDCWICNSSETCASGGNFCSLSSECKRYYYYYTCYDVSQGGGCKSNRYYLTDNSCTGLCDSGKCSGGSCVPACTSHYTYSCYNKDVYWYDSCGNREGKKEECNDGSGWYDLYRCDGNQPQRRYWVRGCSGSSCYTSTNNWSDWGSACPGDYCDYPPGDPYCYNDNVYQDYSCHDAGCSGGSCYDNPYTDKQLIENCNAGAYWTNDYQCSADGRYLQRKYYINDCHNNDCRTRYYWDEDYQDCGTNSWTNEYRCSDSMRQRKAHYKGCSGADCYDYYGWQDYDDCSDCSCSCGGYNVTESTANGNCSDGKDNDCDGKTDSADSGCVTCSANCPSDCSGYDTYRCDTDSTECTYNPYYKSGSYCYYNCSRKDQYGSEWCYCYDKDYCPGTYDECTGSGCKNCAPPTGTIDASKTTVIVGEEFTITITGRDDNDVYYITYNKGSNTWNESNKQKCSWTQTKCTRSWDITENTGGTYTYYGWVQDSDNSGGHGCSSDHKAGIGSVTVKVNPKGCSEQCPAECSGYDSWKCDTSSTRCTSYLYYSSGSYCYYGCSRQSQYGSEWCYCYNKEECNWDYQKCSSSGCACDANCQSRGAVGGYIAPFHCVYCGSVCGWTNYRPMELPPWGSGSVCLLGTDCYIQAFYEDERREDCIGSATRCQLSKCPSVYSLVYNGDSCTVRRSDCTGFWTGEFGLVSRGVWDAYESKCIECDYTTHKETAVCGDTTKNYQKCDCGFSLSCDYYNQKEDFPCNGTGDNQCEWACGASQDCDEKNPGDNCGIGKTCNDSCQCVAPPPDLVIDDFWDYSGTIRYTIRNQGEGNADYSYTALYIDGTYTEYDYVASLSAGSSSYGESFSYDWKANCTDEADLIQVCADYYGPRVDEEDETNNCYGETWDCDNTPPITTISPNGKDWVNYDVGFTLTCADEIGGSGCQTTEYKIIDTSQTCNTSGLTAGTSGTVTCPANQACRKKVCFRSIDNANNPEDIKTSNLFKIDKAAPTTE
ncbi:MAG: hypothetical protein E3J56_00155 [Candidatus Aminicenantes bacterium]|nr:MAG: hypothetical protein E3J56_00155 [Candidatus Aminicenantes bacterium]